MAAFLKSSEDLSLSPDESSCPLMSVIGGSQISERETAAVLEQPKSLGGDCRWSKMLFAAAACLVFGGVAGAWFTTGINPGGLLPRMVQLGLGSILMGVCVSVPGSLLFGRDPIRWGMGMPVMVYFGGVFMALVSGQEGVTGLLYGAPLFVGLAIASGVMGTFLIDGMVKRGGAA